MVRLRTVAVVVLLAASSLLTLKLMGFSQWIQAILVIGVELSLGVVLHDMIERKRDDDDASHHVAAPPPRRRRAAAVVELHRPVRTRRMEVRRLARWSHSRLRLGR